MTSSAQNTVSIFSLFARALPMVGGVRNASRYTFPVNCITKRAKNAARRSNSQHYNTHLVECRAHDGQAKTPCISRTNAVG